MNLLQFLLILKARYKVILVTFLVTLFTAVVVTLFLPKNYTATTSLLLNYKGMDPVTGMVLPAQLMPGYMATQNDIIQSRNIALKVVNQLGLDKSEQAQALFQKSTKGVGDIKNWLSSLLLKNLSVKPSKESSVIEISFNSEDPNFATVVVNSFAENYQQTSTQLKVAPAQQASGYFGQQVKTLRDDLEQAQLKLSNYQQEKGITNPDQNYDIENMRLSELSQQLSAVQVASIETQSRSSNAHANVLNSPDIASSPTIQGLKSDLSRANAKLALLGQRLGKNHPEYKSTEDEANKIKSQLNEEAQSLSSSIGNAASINQQRESQLRSQVEMQKKKVLELNRLRDEMGIMRKDVEVAQKAMDAVTQRFSQTSIEGQSNQSDIAILNPAIAPTSPSSPKVLLNIVLGAFVGLVLGVGFGMFAELLDRRVRGKDDISVILGVPVFAVIEGGKNSAKENLLLGQARKLLTSN